MTRRVRLSLALPLLALVALSACGSSSDGAPRVRQDPLLGTWTFRGRVPAIVDVSLTFNPDKTLTLVEQVAPPTQPVGSTADGCMTTNTLTGTYVEGVSAAGLDTLTWTFTEGTANAQSGCAVTTYNDPGSPMTADGVSSYIEQGILPPMSLTYNATLSTLVLTSKAGTGVGSSTGTIFTKFAAMAD